MMALLCVMPFGLTIGRLTNSPIPTRTPTLLIPPTPQPNLCCRTLSSELPADWCESRPELALCDLYAVNFCAWMECDDS
jgi:hypothetical protein